MVGEALEGKLSIQRSLISRTAYIETSDGEHDILELLRSFHGKYVRVSVELVPGKN